MGRWKQKYTSSKKKCDNSLEPLIPIPPKPLMIKDVIISVIAGVADAGFGQGGAAPPTHASLTPLPRDMSWQPVSASPRGKENTAVNASGTETGGEEQVVAPKDAK